MRLPGELSSAAAAATVAEWRLGGVEGGACRYVARGPGSLVEWVAAEEAGMR